MKGADTSARKRILRSGTLAKAVELPTAYPAPPIRRLEHRAQTIDRAASEGCPMMQRRMQYLCLTKGKGPIHLTPLRPDQAGLRDAEGMPWNGGVDMRP
jgi:hypothetical protein